MYVDDIRTDENGIMLRPRTIDRCVRIMAAEMALPEVKSCLGPLDELDSELIEELIRHIDNIDGFHIYQSLEKKWCGVTHHLIDVFDEDYIGKALDRAVKQWVRCLGVKLDIPVGSQVTWRGEEGIVVEHRADLAQYAIRSPQHSETMSWICDAEEVRIKE